MGCLMDPLAWTDEALGAPPTSIEIKLVDYADAGYLASNKPAQGEIWIRGGGVTDGYLDLPKETEEAFTKDGWFKTGDIGEWDKNGNLKIIDRKKNLVKTLNGEYIALEKVRFVIDWTGRWLTLRSSNPSTERPVSWATSVYMPHPKRPSRLPLCIQMKLL